jgi:hypothetical protein
MPISRMVLTLGQSNSINYGTLNQGFPGGWVSDSGIKIWTGSAFAAYAPGTNSDGNGGGGVWGPEAEYCRQRRLVEPDVPLYIYKHAVGSCGLAAKGAGVFDYSPYTTGTNKQWDVAFSGLVAALNALFGSPYNSLPVIDAMLICNGETDTILMSDADAFQRNLEMLILSFRARTQSHNARAVLMRCFPNSTQGSYLATVRAAQETVGSYYRNAYVNTDDLTESSGFTGAAGHLIPASVVELGLRMYEADQAILP